MADAGYLGAPASPHVIVKAWLGVANGWQVHGTPNQVSVKCQVVAREWEKGALSSEIGGVTCQMGEARTDESSIQDLPLE